MNKLPLYFLLIILINLMPLLLAMELWKHNHRYKPFPDIYAAIESGNIVEVNNFLAKGVPANGKKGYKTPLSIAVEHNKLAIVELLIEHGADVNKKNQGCEETTPIFCAAYAGGLEIIKLLLKNGADATVKNENGKTPLYVAVGWPRFKFNWEVIGPDDRKWTKQEERQRRLKLCSLLMHAGCKSSDKDKEGNTPLHKAVWHGYEEIVELFLQQGEDVNIANNNGYTPLRWAIRTRNLKIAHLLLLAGATFNVEHENGTIVSDAKEIGDQAFIDILCESGVEKLRQNTKAKNERIANLKICECERLENFVSNNVTQDNTSLSMLGILRQE